MRLGYKLVCLIFLVLPSTILAARNPIIWTLPNIIPTITVPGRTYTATYTFTSQLPFTMVKPMVITKKATPDAEFTYDDACTGTKLSPNGTCTVAIHFKPTIAEHASVQLIVGGFDNNQIPVTPMLTTVQGSTGSTVYGTVTQSLPGSLSIGSSGGYQFRFTNGSSSDVSNVSLAITQTAGTPSYTTNCTSTLKAGQLCTVSGGYTPSTSTPNVQGVQGTLSYGSGQSVTVSTLSNIPSTTGLIPSFIGNSEYLSPVMVPTTPVSPYTGSLVGILFTNAGPGTAYITSPTIGVTSGAGATFTVTANSCTGSPLQLDVGAACQLVGYVDTHLVSAGTTVTVTGSVNYATTNGGPSTPVSLASSTNVVATLGTTRTVKLINNCNFDVWYSLNGASEPGSCPAPSYTGCPTGTSCNQSKETCFWTNPTPNTGSIHLTSGGGNSTVLITANPSTDPVVQWSGNISASLNCSGSSCTQAACGNAGGTTPCSPGVGFNQPATQAEFTMLLNDADTYDIETINGFTIPISITPMYTTSITATANNYSCGVAGNQSAANGFGACDWATASVPSNAYYWVTTNSNEGCNSCATNQLCGLDSSFNYGCGSFLGYWSADQACSAIPASNTTVRAMFSCDTQLSTLNPQNFFNSGYILYDLMACSVPKNDPNALFNSCYLTYSGVPANNEIQCCGCIDWWTVSGINSNSSTTSCTQAGQASPQTDPVWNNYVQSTVAWMKKACPSAYVYPFDDKTSTFTCSNAVPGQTNSLDYTITFCPGSNTGLPAGKLEGR